MNKTLLLLLFVFWISFKLQAQKTEIINRQDTLYLNEFYQTSIAQEADIIRVIYDMDSSSNRYIFKEFDKEGNLKKDGLLSKRTGWPNGFITEYYENGNKHLEGNLDEVRKGIWKEWYQNGQLKEEIEYIESEKGKPFFKMINYFDSTGTHLVISGNGIYKEYYRNDVNGQLKKTGLIKEYFPSGRWEGYRENGMLFFNEDYNEQGALIKGESFDELGNKYEYQEYQIETYPKGGFDALYRNIGRNIKYPKSARRKGIQGKVYVQFVVDKNGEVIEVETIKGISPECDKEAERVVREFPKWNPGIQRGQPVKVRMVLPLTFKLG